MAGKMSEWPDNILRKKPHYKFIGRLKELVANSLSEAKVWKHSYKQWYYIEPLHKDVKLIVTNSLETQ